MLVFFGAAFFAGAFFAGDFFFAGVFFAGTIFLLDLDRFDPQISGQTRGRVRQQP